MKNNTYESILHWFISSSAIWPWSNFTFLSFIEWFVPSQGRWLVDLIFGLSCDWLIRFTSAALIGRFDFCCFRRNVLDCLLKLSKMKFQFSVLKNFEIFAEPQRDAPFNWWQLSWSPSISSDVGHWASRWEGLPISSWYGCSLWDPFWKVRRNLQLRRKLLFWFYSGDILEFRSFLCCWNCWYHFAQVLQWWFPSMSTSITSENQGGLMMLRVW